MACHWSLMRPFVALALIVVPACSGRAVDRPAGDVEWRVDTHIQGIEVRVPVAWTIERDGSSGRIDIRGTAGERLTIWPMFADGAGGEFAAGLVLQRLADRLWPDTEWHDDPEEADTHAVALSGTRDDSVLTVLLAWSPSPRGISAVLYASEVPDEADVDSSGIAATIFESLRLGATGSSPGTSSAESAPGRSERFVRWRDPREGAFSVEVPSGWRVRGGTYRYAAVDLRPTVEAESPDGSIVIRTGDASLGPFVTGAIGFAEGTTFSPGYGQQMTVRQLQSPGRFAADYVRSRLAAECADVRITSERDRPDATTRLNALLAQHALASRLAAGDVAFTCSKGTAVMNGYSFVGLQITQMGGPAMWKAEYLHSFLATEAATSDAREALARMVGSFRIDPQWQTSQQQITGATSAIVSRTSEELSRIITEGYWSRQAPERDLSRRRSNATLGIEDVVDPETGQKYRVEAGSNMYWINPRGTIVGTHVDATPGVDFRRLLVER